MTVFLHIKKSIYDYFEKLFKSSREEYYDVKHLEVSLDLIVSIILAILISVSNFFLTINMINFVVVVLSPHPAALGS